MRILHVVATSKIPDDRQTRPTPALTVVTAVEEMTDS